MPGRVWTTGIVVFWAAAMSWLVWNDVLPAWMAQDPPPAVSPDWIAQGREHQQARIEDKYGDRIGTIWTVYHRTGTTITREDTIFVSRFPLLSPARIEIEARFDEQGGLDELTATVCTRGLLITLHGERFASRFAFELKAGTLHQTFRMDHSEVGLIGDLFKPFSAMPDLKVGQAWRMQVFNPLASIAGPGFGDKFVRMVVRVTGTEMVFTPDGPVECLIVEAPNALAKVGPDGTVYVQEIELPVGGRIVIRTEPFDESALRRAKELSLLTGDDS